MIKNIIFDFGDVFINLDKPVIFREMKNYGGDTELTPELIQLDRLFEVGGISSDEFVARLQKVYPKATPEEIIRIWNSMLLDFPEERLEFIENLARESNYRLFLLSNTNALHISFLQGHVGTDRFHRFRSCFEKFYLSHEIGLRKPDQEIYEFIMTENDLKADETLFIDDNKENIEAAEKLGIRGWNLQVGQEDIVQLKSKLY